MRRASTKTDASALRRLVAAARKGDRSAFETLHRRFAGMVHATLLTRLNPADADEVAQETFVVAWGSLADLNDGAAFGKWLQGIARRKAADVHRRTRPTVPLPDQLPGRTPLTAEANQVLSALRTLPAHLAEPLAMRLVKGMTGPEIAAVTGLTHGSVRVTLHRAMKLLRETLEVDRG